MPLYDYWCPCGRTWETFNSIESRDNERCVCGDKAYRRFRLNAKPVVLTYYSEALGAHITGPKQKSQVMKEKNVSEVGKL